MKDATRLIHSGRSTGPLPKTVGPPVVRGSTVLLPNAAALYDEDSPTYGRGGLSTQDALAAALSDLEGARGVRLFPSGLAALTGAMLAVLKAGDEILVTDSIYKPTRRFCDRVLRRFGVGVRYYSPRMAPLELLAMATDATRLILMESPGSLTLEMQDVGGIAALASARGILTLVDNTWAAGLYFRPLEHGVSLCVQALTKYVGGHSDVFMGSVATRDEALVRALDNAVWDMGWSVSPDDAYQMLRGLRTLETRMARHDASGRQIAMWLTQQPGVAQVLHPALPKSADYALWARDFTGAAGLFAVVLDTHARGAAHAFLNALTVFRLGFSWGGFESLALDCDPQFHVRQAPREYEGPIIRLNIGLEAPEDLIADLERGLQASRRV